MKTILLLFLLTPLFALSQTGQVIRVINEKGDTAHVYLNWHPTPLYNSAIYLHEPKPIFDTIPVIILVSDTTSHPLYGLSSERQISYQDNKCYWQRGYSVCELRQDYGLNYNRKHVKYLDSNRKSLKSEIVVWMSKEVIK